MAGVLPYHINPNSNPRITEPSDYRYITKTNYNNSHLDLREKLAAHKKPVVAKSNQGRHLMYCPVIYPFVWRSQEACLELSCKIVYLYLTGGNASCRDITKLSVNRPLIHPPFLNSRICTTQIKGKKETLATYSIFTHRNQL